MLESTGLYGKSYTQWADLDHGTGRITPSPVKVPYLSHLFGEGISKLTDDTWIELTWKEKKVNILDRDSLETVSEMPMWKGVKEGWGITLDPEKKILYVSDGSQTITRVNADTLK